MRQSLVDDFLSEEEEDEDTQKDKYLTFRLGDEDFGIEIRHVTEIVSIQKITAVPDLPAFVKGAINLRGQVIPVIDLRLRFGMPPREYSERTCIVITRLGDITVGMVVDMVSEVLVIPASDMSPPPSMSRGGAGGASRFVQGLGRVEDSVKIILNAGKMLRDDEMEAVAGVMA